MHVEMSPYQHYLNVLKHDLNVCDIFSETGCVTLVFLFCLSSPTDVVTRFSLAAVSISPTKHFCCKCDRILISY